MSVIIYLVCFFCGLVNIVVVFQSVYEIRIYLYAVMSRYKIDFSSENKCFNTLVQDNTPLLMKITVLLHAYHVQNYLHS